MEVSELQGEEEEDLGDFMEVVTTYKCKFCQFTCNTTQQMAQHVRSTHQTYRKKPDFHPIADVINQDLTSTDEDTNTPEPESSADIHVLNDADALSESYGQKEETNIIVSDELQNTIQPDILTVASNRNVIEGNSGVLGGTVSMSNVQFINSDGSGQFILQDGVQLEQGSTVQVLVHNADFDITKNSDESAESFNEEFIEAGKVSEVGETGSGNLHYVIENGDVYTKMDESEGNQVTTTEIQTETNSLLINEDGNPVEVEQVNENIRVEHENTGQGEMELFLCGNCQQGFTTIQDCKDHMTKEHEPNDPPPKTKVDAGTQMEPRKKVGRKRKSEIAAAATKEEVVEEIVMSDSDEDWSEKMESYGSYTTRSKRKRQPPKTLRNDFYLGKSKKKDPKKHEDSGLHIKCTMKGCTARFRGKETLDKHLTCHIPGAKDSENQFKCLICDAQFMIWKLARYHMWKQHKVDMDLLTCSVCLTFKTDTMSKLKVHQEIHSEERPYSCSICGKGFKQLAQMKNHEVLHEESKSGNIRTGDSERWHTPKTCDICERTFSNAKCLKMHKEIIHSQIKPFKCQYCDHECSRKAMMILHERTHTGEKPFKCDLCQYSCGDHNSLRRHKMRHTGQKPYKCPHCPYACIQAISLKVHIKNKHPGMGGIYNCSMCLYRTVNVQQYENHLKDHKNGLIEKTAENAGQGSVKSNTRQRKARNIMPKNVTTIAVPHNLIPDVSSISGPMHSMAIPQILHIPASAFPGVENLEPLEMQIEMKEDGNHVISMEDLAKLTGNNNGLQPDAATAQLIYSALSAISQNQQNDVQTSIQTDSNQGVTTHTITFHLPESEVMSSQENIVNKEQNEGGVTIIQVEGDTQSWQVNGTVDLENT